MELSSPRALEFEPLSDGASSQAGHGEEQLAELDGRPGLVEIEALDEYSSRGVEGEREGALGFRPLLIRVLRNRRGEANGWDGANASADRYARRRLVKA